jgi:hypothetical protein
VAFDGPYLVYVWSHLQLQMTLHRYQNACLNIGHFLHFLPKMSFFLPIFGPQSLSTCTASNQKTGMAVSFHNNFYIIFVHHTCFVGFGEES